MALPPTYGQIQGRSPVWLLDLDLGGDVRRYATRAVTVTDNDGATYDYVSGLTLGAVEIGEAIDRVSVRIDDIEEDWAQYRARGGEIAMRTATLRLWWSGLTVEQSMLVLSGRLSGLTISPPGAPGQLRASVRGDLMDNATASPPEQAVIDDVTFTHTLGSIEIDDDARGTHYPIIVGYPGTGDAVDDGASPSGCVVVKLAQISGAVSTTKLLISMGTIDAAIVHVWDRGAEQGATGTPSLNRHGDMSITAAADNLGRTYSYASFNATPGDTEPEFVAGHTYVASFRTATGYGGGILNREGSGPLRGLGEVIRYCLEASGVAVDVARQESERDRLDAYKIDGLIAGGSKGRVDLAQWVNDDLTALFPILRMRNADGVWYRLWNLLATENDAIARLDADTGEVSRTTGLRRVEGQYNRFTLNYGHSDIGPTRALTLAPESDRYDRFAGADSRIIGSLICRASRELYGDLVAPLLEPDFIWSRSTAAGILEYQALRYALPIERVTYDGLNLEYLEPGDVVLINDSSVYLSDRVALVESLTVGETPTEIVLVLLPRFDRLTA